MRRWTCTTCGSGVNAPERMRKDDTRRYCLACSAKAPRLVERTCPALEARRKNKRAARGAKKAEQQSKRESLPWALRDELIQKEFRRLLRLKCWRDKLRYRDISLKLRRSRTPGRKHYSGFADYFADQIVLTLATKPTAGGICESLLHEIAHMAAPVYEHHGDLFRSLLMEAAAEAYGIEPPDEIPQGMYHYDRALEVAIDRALGDQPPGARQAA